MRYIVVLLLGAGLAYGQPYMPQSRELENSNDARTKRAAREMVAKKVGLVARNFVETYGEDAVAACVSCSSSAGAKLARFHASGGLDKLPSAARLLRAITGPQGGDDVVDFVVTHGKELERAERFEVFVADPVTYAMSLKTLDKGVADWKQQRESYQQQLECYQQQCELQAKVRQERIVDASVGGGLLLLLILGAWRYSRNRFS